MGAIQGEADSEVFFYWILQNIDQSGSVEEGIKRAIGQIADYTALNFLLSDGATFYAYRDARKQFSDYTLYYLKRIPSEVLEELRSRELSWMLRRKAERGEQAVLVCSEKLTHEECWEEIPLGTLLVIPDDLKPREIKVRPQGA